MNGDLLEVYSFRLIGLPPPFNAKIFLDEQRKRDNALCIADWLVLSSFTLKLFSTNCPCNEAMSGRENFSVKEGEKKPIN